MNTPTLMTAAGITAELEKFIAPSQVTELRALHVGGPRRTVAGWFDGRHLHDLARTALALTRQAAGVYFVPNPIHPDLLARCPNRAEECRRGRVELTTDADVLERRYLIVDLDPDRADGTADQPSADAELAASMSAAVEVIEELRPLEWPWPMWIRSGNGTTLVFPLAAAIPAKVPAGHPDPLRDTLAMLGRSRFRGRDLPVRVGTDTHAAGAMLPVPGAWVRKGEQSADGAERRHRTAAVLDTPDDWPVPVVPPDPQPAGAASVEYGSGAAGGSGVESVPVVTGRVGGKPAKGVSGRRSVGKNATPAMIE